MPVELQRNPLERAGQAPAGRLRRLCDFSGGVKAFWAEYLAVLAESVEARAAVLLRANAQDPTGWKRVLAWPSGGVGESRQFLATATDVAEACTGEASSRRAVPGGWCLGRRLADEREGEVWVAVLLLPELAREQADESLRRLGLLAHFPAVYQLRQRTERSEQAVTHFASVLELISLLDEHARFPAMAMALCNELAARHRCARVSLGWLEGEEVRLKALSHSEKFDRRTEEAQRLEAAMDEGLDQDEVIVWPEPAEQGRVTRDHARLAASGGAPFVCSLPLRRDGVPVAVLTCERGAEAFAEVELRLLALCGDMGIRRLADLHRSDRWWGARWLTGAREQFAKVLGPRHTGAKLLGLGLTAVLAFLVFGRVSHRVEASFTLAAARAAYLSAPFAGYIDEVRVELGSEVREGETLATLDPRELLLEEAAALADQVRYQREAEKARAAEKIGEMRIGEAQAEQARARLELVRHRRGQAVVVAPFDSVVVEGDLKKRIGAPVKQGDVLFKVTRLDQLYAECEVPESEAHSLRPGGRGEIAFASMPKLRFPVHIESIEPVARSRESGNVVVARCILDGGRPDWWRPGMRGAVRLAAGERAPLWIIGHGTADFLRMHLWW